MIDGKAEFGFGSFVGFGGSGGAGDDKGYLGFLGELFREVGAELWDKTTRRCLVHKWSVGMN